ncbi:unnamed protein product [Pseudo-nitzschia multistriata]|uniref:Uncharacterized protein n=1 Tax=Pseudo-nitzschia multistriata TaxID=183589 RepID=A0A448ZDW6_9STRA|nr:unnamed protein product [Pseudo-nitzschia multistriata]
MISSPSNKSPINFVFVARDDDLRRRVFSISLSLRADEGSGSITKALSSLFTASLSLAEHLSGQSYPSNNRTFMFNF